MVKTLVHVFSFFWKEVSEIIRQPRLVLSLILGPFLVLLLFGVSFSGGIPLFRVALVVPQDSIPEEQLNNLKETIADNFILVSSDDDEAAALERLRRDEVDIVQIIPTGIQQKLAEGEQSAIKFVYREVNPFDESWVKYLGSTQVSEVNRLLLVQTLTQVQEEGDVASDVSPQAVVSPLKPEYENLNGSSLSFVNFYGPSVLALIIQHIAVTLGALSLVHEQSRGTLEMFHIAPVSSWSIIAGKYLGYTLFLAILAAILVGLLVFLGTPFLGNLLLFAALVLLFIFASLGIGFMISSVSSTDGTAMQLSMLTLLFTIFFSGFFLPLENFNSVMRPITNIVPLTQGLQGFQNIMLKGTLPTMQVWIILGVITVVTFLAVQILFRRQMKHL